MRKRICKILFLNRIGGSTVEEDGAVSLFLDIGFSLKESLFGFYSTSEPPPEGETAIFLHGQEKIWKGFINMQAVAKFVTKAYLVSGSFEHLKEVSSFAW